MNDFMHYLRGDDHPLDCISPNRLMSDKTYEVLDGVFQRGAPMNEEELENIRYYEEGQEVAFNYPPLKTTAKVTKFSAMSSSFELSGRTEITDIARSFWMMKFSLARRIVNYIDERMVEFGESCEAILYSCPIKTENGRLFKGNGIYYASEQDHKHWNYDFRVDLFITPVIYPTDMKKLKKAYAEIKNSDG